MRAEALEQRPQRVGELERDRDVVTRVGAEARGGRGVVAPDDAWMKHHHEPVVARHPRHLEHHVPPERDRLGRGRLACERGPVDALGIGEVERIGACIEMAVVRRGCAMLDEELPPLLERPEIARVVARVDPRCLGQLGDRRGPARLGGLEKPVGPERRDHPPRPGRVLGQTRCGPRSSHGSSVVASTSIPKRS